MRPLGRPPLLVQLFAGTAGGCPGGAEDHPRARQGWAGLSETELVARTKLPGLVSGLKGDYARGHLSGRAAPGSRKWPRRLAKRRGCWPWPATGSSTKHQLLDSAPHHRPSPPSTKHTFARAGTTNGTSATALVQKSRARSAEQARGRPAHRLLRARSCLAADAPGSSPDAPLTLRPPRPADQHRRTKRGTHQKLKIANLLKRPQLHALT